MPQPVAKRSGTSDGCRPPPSGAWRSSGARAATTAECRLAHELAASARAAADSRLCRAARSGSTRPRIGARSTRAARPSPCSAAASTSSIPIATRRCSPTSPRAGGLLSEYAPGTPPRARTVPRAQPDRRRAGRGGRWWSRRAFASGALITARVATQARAPRCSRCPAARAPTSSSRRARRGAVDGRDALRGALAGEAPAARAVPARFAPLVAALRGRRWRPAELGAAPGIAARRCSA